MRNIRGLVTVMACVAMVSAQPKHTVEPSAFHDSLQTAGKVLDVESAKLNLQERRLALAEKAQELVIREEERGKIFRDEIDEMVNPGMHHWGMMSSHGRMMELPVWAKTFFGMLFCVIFLLVNILLTVLVSMDMARNKRFNGLWIPVLLIAGIPGTAIYALFRIGDIVAAGEAKPN